MVDSLLMDFLYLKSIIFLLIGRNLILFFNKTLHNSFPIKPSDPNTTTLFIFFLFFNKYLNIFFSKPKIIIYF